MAETYRAPDFVPEAVSRRYVSFLHPEFRFVDVDEKGFTIREGTLPEDSIPAEYAAQAKALRGFYPHWVIMPDDWRSPAQEGRSHG